MNAMSERWMPAALPPRLVLPMQQLMAQVLGGARERGVKQVMLVGAGAGVGTSFVARHWAGQLAQAFGSVLVVEVRPGVADGIAAAESPAALAAASPVTRLTLPEPACLSQAGTGEGTLPREWLDAFGVVLWDVPPLSQSPVAMVLARKVDGIALLVQAYRTRRHVAMHAVQRLRESGGAMLGVVFNRAVNIIPGWLYRRL